MSKWMRSEEENKIIYTKKKHTRRDNRRYFLRCAEDKAAKLSYFTIESDGTIYSSLWQNTVYSDIDACIKAAEQWFDDARKERKWQ